MRPGRHAAGDGSFSRSASAVGLRGAGLLLVAVIIGVVLLNSADDGPDTTVRAGATESTTTTAAAPASTTTTVATRPAEQVKVLAANGTTTKGQGTRLTERLKGLGYNALAPTDAAKKPAAASTVFWAVGYQPEARALAQQLGLAPTAVQPLGSPPPVASPGAANVIVVVGDDLARTLTPTTSTTVKSTTATTARGTTSTTVRRTTTTAPRTTTTAR